MSNKLAPKQRNKAVKFQEFYASTDPVNCAVLGKQSPSILATGGDDSRVNVWKVDKRDPVLSLTGHQTEVDSVQFDSEDVLLAAGSRGGSVKLWDLSHEKLVRTLSGHRASISCIDFHPYGDFFVSGSLDTNIKVWDIKKKGCMQTYKGHAAGISCIRHSPDGRWVVSGDNEGEIKVWDLTAGKHVAEFRGVNLKGPVTSMDFHPNEFILAVAAEKNVTFWDMETFQVISSTPSQGTGVRSIRFTHDGGALLSGCADSLRAWSWEPLDCLDIVDAGWSNLTDISLDADNNLVGVSVFKTVVSVFQVDITAQMNLPKIEDLEDSTAAPADTGFINMDRYSLGGGGGGGGGSENRRSSVGVASGRGGCLGGGAGGAYAAVAHEKDDFASRYGSGRDFADVGANIMKGMGMGLGADRSDLSLSPVSKQGGTTTTTMNPRQSLGGSNSSSNNNHNNGKTKLDFGGGIGEGASMVNHVSLTRGDSSEDAATNDPFHGASASFSCASSSSVLQSQASSLHAGPLNSSNSGTQPASFGNDRLAALNSGYRGLGGGAKREYRKNITSSDFPLGAPASSICVPLVTATMPETEVHSPTHAGDFVVEKRTGGGAAPLTSSSASSQAPVAVPSAAAVTPSKQISSSRLAAATAAVAAAFSSSSSSSASSSSSSASSTASSVVPSSSSSSSSSSSTPLPSPRSGRSNGFHSSSDTPDDVIPSSAATASSSSSAFSIASLPSPRAVEKGSSSGVLSSSSQTSNHPSLNLSGSILPINADRDRPLQMNISAIIPPPSASSDVLSPLDPVSESEALRKKIMSDHSYMITALTQRLHNVKVLNALWVQGNAKGALEALVDMNDLPVSVDFFNNVEGTLSSNWLTLDMCRDVLPLLRKLLTTPTRFEGYVHTSLTYLVFLLKAFSSVIASTLSSAQMLHVVKKVDLQSEERHTRCSQVYALFKSFQSVVAPIAQKQRAVGILAKEAMTLLDSLLQL